MLNQQLLDYIKQRTQQGVSQEQIKNSLIANGWPEQDIEEGFKNINTPDIHKVVPAVASNSAWKVIVEIVIGVVVLGGVTYLTSQTILKSKDALKTSNEISNQSLTATPSNTTTAQPSLQPATQSQDPEIVFADKLNSCTPYKISFKHPLTGDLLEKEILGVINEKCDYVEQMPNNGKMECKYTESERKAAAQYYKDVASAESLKMSADLNLVSGEKKMTYIVDGKVIDNPLQDFLDNDVCVITGY